MSILLPKAAEINFYLYKFVSAKAPAAIALRKNMCYNNHAYPI